MKQLGKYKNGNYTVTIYEDGTKVRFTKDDEFYPEFAENCDVKITDKCSIGCAFCLTENTLIKSKEKNIPIKDIKIGDIVYSYNEIAKKFELKPVIEVYKRKFEGTLIQIELENGIILECTPNHKIFTSNRGWIEAENILESDDILLYN